jgi:Fe-S cluster assembly iron-binding protein IscA
MLKKKPILKLSSIALDQLVLMLKHDYTLADKVFRLSIDTKGCDGFTYAAGFTEKNKNDLLISFEHHKVNITMALDPFAAEYMKFIEIDYCQDFKNNQEGFTVKNRDENSYRGKFWKQNPELIPTQVH